MKYPFAIGALCAALSLAACGGGGGSTPPTSGGGSQPVGQARFTITDPLAPVPTASQARPQNFSRATALLQITINGTTVQVPLSVNSTYCQATTTTISCEVDAAAPNGPIEFTVETLDTSFDVLSTTTGTATINGPTIIPLTLEGIWHTAIPLLANEHPLMGSPVTIPVTIDAYDAGGALIVGPEPYTSPLPLYNSDTTGATSFSVTSVTGPSETVTFSFDGTSYVSPQLAAGPPPSEGLDGHETLVPALNVTEYPIPSGGFTGTLLGQGNLISNPGGSLTFAEQNSDGPGGLEQQLIGTVTMSGTITEVPSTYYTGLVHGANGDLYGISHGCSSGCVSQDNNAIRDFTTGTLLPMFPDLSDGPIVVGADGNFWMPASDSSGNTVVQRVTPAGVATDFPVSGTAYIFGGIGPDGNVWFTGYNASGIGSFVRVDQSGTITVFPTGDTFSQSTMAVGPDSQIYSLFANQLIGRTTTAGAYSQLQIGSIFLSSVSPTPIAFGPDGAVWISSSSYPSIQNACAPTVQRITTTGSYAWFQLPVPCPPAGAYSDPINSFAIGSDGNLWYTRGSFVGRIVLR